MRTIVIKRATSNMRNSLIIISLLISSLLTYNLYLNNKKASFTQPRAQVNITPVISISLVPSPTTSPVSESNIRPIAIGMWTQGFWDDAKKELHPEKLTEVEQLIDKKFAIAHYYRGWDVLDKETVKNELNSITEQGWTPMLSANPYYFDQCRWEDRSIYQVISEGKCDTFLQSVARNFKLFGKPLYFRFAWEMNLPNIEWGIKATKSSPEDFIAAWRHFHDIVKNEGTDNVIWVFSPNSETNESVPYNRLYPGDDYVDWLGIDVYNWGTTQSWSSWQNFIYLFSSSYNHLVQISPNKPLMISEVNTTDQGGNKAEWYSNLLNTEIPYKFPQIKAVVFYNENRTLKENVNWLIDINPASLDAFKQGISNGFYTSSL